jgi:hypothetical protein
MSINPSELGNPELNKPIGVELEILLAIGNLGDSCDFYKLQDRLEFDRRNERKEQIHEQKLKLSLSRLEDKGYIILRQYRSQLTPDGIELKHKAREYFEELGLI